MIKLIFKIIPIIFVVILISLLGYVFIQTQIELYNYDKKVFADNKIYFIKNEPIEVNKNCWLITTYWNEIFFCGEIYVK